MAIVQISKIIHRVGSQADLPQLDTGEIAFSTDTRQVFIGNDPILYPPPTDGTTQTEILTDQSSIDFARLNGSENVTMLLEDPEEGQILGLGVVGDAVALTNLGGDAVTTANVTRPKINLGDIANVKIQGNAFNGAVLQTDGSGNLSWTTNGLFKVDIQTISKANPAVVTTKSEHFFGTGSSVNLYAFEGMTELLADGDPAGSTRFWVERLSNVTFSLYEDSTRSSPVNSSTYEDYTANTGYAWGGIPATGNASPGGANTQLQFNDAGGFMGSNKLTFNKTTNNLAITGNLIVTTGRLYGNTQGDHNGRIGATTANTGAFTSVTVSSTATVTGNVTAGNVSSAGSFSGASSTITGNITSNNSIANSAYFNYTGGNAWHMFANATGIFFSDSGSGNTYRVNLTQV